ncbi:MAG: serine/threonine-protein kinase, partial [Myxococcota bacterium]
AKTVAVKRLLPEFRDDPTRIRGLIEEACLAASLSHGNLARIIDLVEVGDEWRIIVEYVPGLDLRQLNRLFAQNGRRLGLPECLYVVQELLIALDYLHNTETPDGLRRELVHGDVAPSNVMISAAGEVKLIDFGMLRDATAVRPSIGGKLRYASPEQMRGRQVDAQSDLYAVGLIMWELLAGARIFEGMTQQALILAVQQAAVPPIELWRPDVPPVVMAIVLRATAVEPERRFFSAADFLRALARVEVAQDAASRQQVLAGLIRRIRAMGVSSASSVPVEAAVYESSLEEALNQQLQ